uniref:Chemokine interleukin-8-like domain-containing protein n=1 Tax=Astatotilapia calliptera TaxID=8154 RepID=A0AAX7UI02_ASTCA
TVEAIVAFRVSTKGSDEYLSVCCVSWSKTRVPLDRIVNYAIQSEDTCRIKAVRYFLVKIKHVRHEDSGFKAVGQLGHSKLTSGVNVHVNDCMWSCDGPASCPRSTLPLALG